MDKDINITLNLSKEDTRFLRRMLDKQWSALNNKYVHENEPNDYVRARLKIDMNRVRDLENEIFHQELNSEANL